METKPLNSFPAPKGARILHASVMQRLGMVESMIS